MLPSTDYYLVYHVSQLGIMSHAASSCTTARTRRSAPDMTGCVDPEAPIDEVSKLPLIKCPECKDRRVFPATTMKSEANRGKRYFKCPRKSYVSVVTIDFVWTLIFNLHCPHLINFQCGCRGDVRAIGLRKNM
jgi:hypothetical protein